MQKGGTRWLYDSLSTHPDVWLPPVKELHYFDGKFRSGRARWVLDRSLRRIVAGMSVDTEDLEFLRRAAIPRRISDEDYAGFFTSTRKRVTGEVTPSYSTLDGDRIRHVAALFPELKLILMIRDPAARAWSQLSMDALHHRVAQDALSDPDRVRALLGRARISQRSSASATYRRWAEVFGQERVLVLFSDHLRSEPDSVCRRAWRFLDLRTTPQLIQGALVADAKKDVRRLRPTPEVAALLAEEFSDEVAQCRELFGGPALNW